MYTVVLYRSLMQLSGITLEEVRTSSVDLYALDLGGGGAPIDTEGEGSSQREWRVAGITGKIIFLRVHRCGTRYAEMDTEVVVKLNTDPNRTYSFQLRQNGELPAHQAMFQLLRDAFRSDWNVQLEYERYFVFNKGWDARTNHRLIRVILTK